MRVSLAPWEESSKTSCPMITSATPLLLGSASPRRREILAGLGIPLQLSAAHIEEDIRGGESPLGYIERIVAEKLAAVAELGQGARCAGSLVADTIVVIDGEVLGKPSDAEDAARLLAQLAGRTHTVYTRYAVTRSPELATPAVARTVESRVTMRSASADELERYAATGEGLDKAGAYAVQGIGAFLVERIEGSYSNVVGLPACEVIVDLLRIGLLEQFPC
jgi:septum formation protein